MIYIGPNVYEIQIKYSFAKRLTAKKKKKKISFNIKWGSRCSQRWIWQMKMNDFSETSVAIWPHSVMSHNTAGLASIVNTMNISNLTYWSAKAVFFKLWSAHHDGPWRSTTWYVVEYYTTCITNIIWKIVNDLVSKQWSFNWRAKRSVWEL